jgi:hypothetical protein
MDRESRRGRRIRHTERIIRNRLRFLRIMGPDEWYRKNLEEPHRLAKKHPWDCGKSKCWLCHFEKLAGIKKKKYETLSEDLQNWSPRA